MAAMLFQPPVAVGVMEPWDALRLAPAELFASLRRELRSGELRRGHLDARALRAEGAVVICTQAEHRVAVALDDDGVMAVRRCGAVWTLCPTRASSYVCAIRARWSHRAASSLVRGVTYARRGRWTGHRRLAEPAFFGGHAADHIAPHVDDGFALFAHWLHHGESPRAVVDERARSW